MAAANLSSAELLEESLNTEVLQHLTNESKQCPLDVFVIPVYDPGQVQAQIDKCIENTVAGLVEEEFNKFVPKEIRDRVDEQRSDIRQLYVQLYNSLSIPRARTRPQIKYSLVNDHSQRSSSLEQLYQNPKTVRGKPPAHYKRKRNKKQFIPKDRKRPAGARGSAKHLIFSPPMSHSPTEITAPKVVELVRFYGMEVPDQKSKVPNLNWFLREIGITYQYVYSRPFRPFPP